MKWETKSLDELGIVARGKSKHRPRNDPSLYGGRYPFIQTAEVKSANMYITEYKQTYNDKGLLQSKIWDSGTLCITIAANIADTAILTFPACFPDSIIGFIPYEGIADTRYIKYCFDLTQQNFKQISQGATQDNLSLEKLATIKFPVPDLKLQQRIADILSAYDDLIENNQKQIRLQEEAAMLLYKEWFVNLRFPGYENTKIVDGVPEGWELTTVKEMGQVITGKTPSTAIAENYGKDIPFVKIPDMHGVIYPLKTEVKLSERGANTQKNKLLPPKSIMVSCIATVGLVCIAHEACQTNQQVNSIILNDEDHLYYMFFKMKGIKSLLEGVGSNGATMTNVNKTKFENIELLKPENEILKKFNNLVEPFYSNILALSKQNEKLKEARDKLLSKLMSGEIEV
jgi:type I restriction enzyme S subunit